MKVDLLPCPFCGAIPGIGGDGIGGTHIWCNNPDCPIEVRFLHHVPEADAIAAWNRRADTPQLDWDKAAAHLEFYAKVYDELPGGAGRFGMAITIMPLQDRLERGERTKWLYDAIMEVE